MADDIAPHIGSAALRPVQIRDSTLDPLEGQTGPKRGAEFAGIGGGDIIGRIL